MSTLKQFTPLLWVIARCLPTILVFLKMAPPPVEKSTPNESVLLLGDRLEALGSPSRDCQARFSTTAHIKQPPSLDLALIVIQGVG